MDSVGDAESISTTSHRLTHMIFTGDALYTLVLGKGRAQLSPGVFDPIDHSMIGDLPSPKSSSTWNPSRCPRRGLSGHGIH